MQPWPDNRPDNTLSACFHFNDDLISETAGLPLPLDLRHGHGGVVAECWRGGAPAGPRLEAVQPHLKPGASVLDLCGGSGEAAAPWLAAGYAVTGLDISPRALDLAAQRHPSLERVEGLAEDPPLADASFSAIQLLSLIHI